MPLRLLLVLLIVVLTNLRRRKQQSTLSVTAPERNCGSRKGRGGGSSQRLGPHSTVFLRPKPTVYRQEPN